MLRKTDSSLIISWVRSDEDYDCKVCSGTIPRNPSLCEACQIWNDGKHVFECMKPVEHEQYVDQGPQSIPVKNLLQEQGCMICTAVAAVVREKLDSSSATDDMDNPKLRVLVCGPYHMDTEPFESRRPWVSEHSRIMRGSEKKRMSEIRCICLLLVCADPEAFVREMKEPYHNSAVPIAKFGVSRPWPDLALELQLDLKYASAAFTLQSVSRWDFPRYFEPAKLRSLIDRCATRDEGGHARCVSPDGGQLPLGFRLIDVNRLCIVEPPEAKLSFIALSYTWISTTDARFSTLETRTLAELSEPYSISVERVPDIIWDSIVLCRDLNEKFLWVDRLCIVQDDHEAKQTQINSMNSIYRNAVVTIVSASDQILDVGLPGVRGRPRRSHVLKRDRNFGNHVRGLEDNTSITINKSLWNTRGWTLQERLLPQRCIYVTNYQTYFTCTTHLWAEENAHLLTSNASDFDSVKLPNVADFLQYSICVELYSQRNLSYEEDVLNAFAGIGNEIQKTLGTKLHFGLPAKYLPQALLWSADEHPERRPSMSQLPSWTWAAWKGRLLCNHPFTHDGLNPTFGTLIRIFVVSPQKQLTPIHAEERWFCEPVSLEDIVHWGDLETDVWGGLDSMLPESPTQSWSKCPHNPWTAFEHSSLDREALSRAAACLNALVFNTTSALLGIGDENELFDGDGRQVGSLIRRKMPILDRSSKAKTSACHEFVVICAGSYPKSFSAEEDRFYYCWKHEAITYPWVLLVMQIDRDDADPLVCRRVDVGYVEARCWEQCRPHWKTTVLV
ncbi:hypothetical protein LTR85_001087 [Meristemomyces frigidus]|nr:hypothetical protein LTR85_001087 [Meristemomyces frigidus]